jgi:exonuclease SbcC
MSKDQFCQVVLLPQGEFAAFLRAGAGERAALLGKLFDTRRFRLTEEVLRERKRAAEADLDAADRELLALGERVEQAAGQTPGPAPAERPAVPAARRATAPAPAPAPDLALAGAPEDDEAATPPAAGDPSLAERLLARAAVLRCTAHERHAIAASAVRAATEADRAARAHAAEVRDRAAAQARHAAARDRAARLAAGRPRLDALADRLAAADRADRATPALAPHARATAEADRAARRADQALTDLAALTARDAGPIAAEHWERADADALAAAERAAREEIGALGQAADAEREAARAAGELARLATDTARDEAAADEARDWLTGWPAHRDALRQRAEAARNAAAEVAALTGELAAADRVLAAARRRDALHSDLAAARETHRTARDAAADARDAWLAAREARIDGMAAELAAALTPGDPCRVCGATEHPAPARPAAHAVTGRDEDAAQAGYATADAARENAARAVERITAALEAERAAAGDAPLGALTAARDALSVRLAEARRAAGDAHAAHEALDQAEREHDRRAEQLRAAEGRTAAATARREALEERRAALADRLERARAGHRDVAARRAALTARADALAAAARAVTAARTAADALGEATAARDAALRSAGFTDPTEVGAAALPAAEREALHRAVRAGHDEAAAVAAALADPEARAAAELPPADPAAADRAAERAAARLREATARAEAAGTRRAALDALGARLAERAAALAPSRAAYDRLRRLADLAAGNAAENRLHMELETYVLAARLEQVAAAASTRLLRMSGGRYTLVHTDARATGRGRSGLGLLVVDAWTGTERDTATLSGGETFFASLALALGLADVVTDEAGGRRLDTLFIDEGFGSLDEQTLDEVLDVLDSLRERDRAVGIVSHVPELRQRVPAQLRVEKGRTGSVVRQRVPSAP